MAACTMVKTSARALSQFLSNIPLFAWVLAGFLLSHFFFFVYPVFLSAPAMRLTQIVPAADFAGADLEQILSYSRSWLVEGKTPYIGQNLYPPLASVFFAPLVFVELTLAYRAVTVINFLLFGLLILAPFFVWNQEDSARGQASCVSARALSILCLASGLFSYGFQFEIERGQFNLIAVCLCLLGVWLFHYQERLRLLAYLLFTVAVQLKIYPFIFIFMFVSDWQDWKNNIKRTAGIAAANILFLFALGPGVFMDFIAALKEQSNYPFVWGGNHSIHSYLALAAQHALENGRPWLDGRFEAVKLLLLLVVGASVLTTAAVAYHQNRKGVDSRLLLACALGAMVIPSVSHDYKLSILATPTAILLSDLSSRDGAEGGMRTRIASRIMAFALSAAYFSTLYPPANKPPFLDNNFPALMIMLCAAVGVSLLGLGNANAQETSLLPPGERNQNRQ